MTNQTSWNPLGWKTETGIVDGGMYKAKIKYGYDNYGRLEWAEDAVGNRTRYGYDQWSRQTTFTHPDQSVEIIAYDDINLTNTGTDASGYAIKEYYDKLGRTLKTEEIKLVGAVPQTNLMATYTYDYAGNVLTTTEHAVPSNTTAYGYDVLGRLSSVSNAINEVTSYAYDWTSNLTQVTYPDSQTNIKRFDEIGRLIQSTDANGQSEKYKYDANGNKIGLRDKNNTTFKYAFDQRNRLVHKDILNAQGQPILAERISFTYDLAGNRKTMTDATGTTAYDYVPATGALRQVTYPDGKAIQYDYDITGNRSAMKDPFGAYIYYKYDQRNRLEAVGASLDFHTDKEAKYAYYANGLLKKIDQRNGVTSEFSYNGLRLDVLEEKKADGTLLNRFAYSYSNNGNITSKTENGTTNSFAYDPLNRIETSTQLNEIYTYDNRGNRGVYATNQTADSPDATYHYDKRDQLIEVVRARDNHSVAYRYNGDGLLWERMDGGQVTRYYNDGNQVIAEGTVVNGVSELKARYIRGQGLIAREDAGGKSYYLHNGHGDVVELRDSTGNTLLNQYSYDIWGNPIIAQENVDNPFRYSGEMTDSTTSLQYLRARWYDTSLGRFINEDSYEGTLTNPLSQNLYTYVSNNPLKYTDPSGHIERDDKNLSKGDQGLIYESTDQFYRAKARGDTAAMQYYHDRAVAIRLLSGKYEVVGRTNFATGTTAAIATGSGGAHEDLTTLALSIPAIAAGIVYAPAALAAADVATMGVSTSGIATGTVVAGKSIGSLSGLFGPKTTTLYRSVSVAELAGINTTKAFESGYNMEGKWMATTFNDAVAWGQKMDGGNTRIISIQLPTSSLSKMHFDNTRLDGIGNAYYSEVGFLNSVFINVTVVK